MNTFLERLNWLIKKLAGGKPYRFAKMAGIESGTFQPYIKKGRVPKIEQLLSIRSTFGVNLNWLLSGDGEPFEINRGQVGSHINDEVVGYGPGIKNIDGLLEKARKVLNSGNPIAFDALSRNINYFAYAIDQERRLEVLEKRFSAFEKVVDLAAVDRIRSGDLQSRKDELIKMRVISTVLDGDEWPKMVKK